MVAFTEQIPRARDLRRLFGRSFSGGHFIATYSCGIVANRTVLYGGEGSVRMFTGKILQSHRETKKWHILDKSFSICTLRTLLEPDYCGE